MATFLLTRQLNQGHLANKKDCYNITNSQSKWPSTNKSGPDNEKPSAVHSIDDCVTAIPLGDVSRTAIGRQRSATGARDRVVAVLGLTLNSYRADYHDVF